MSEDTPTPEAKETEAKAPETPESEESKVIEQADKPDAVRSLIDREREARRAADKKVEELAAKVKAAIRRQ